MSTVSSLAQKLAQMVTSNSSAAPSTAFDPSSVAFKASDRDRSTLSNYLEIHTKHISLDWAVDWEKQLISGSVELELVSVHDAAVAEIVLDTSYLNIRTVHTRGDALEVGSM
jgi:aminopeptidase N